MSIRVTANVFGNFHEDSEASDRLVLIFLADAAHDDGICWPSQSYIAERLRLGERTVRRSLSALAERGEIEIRKVSRGRARVSVYRVSAADLEPQYDRLPFALPEPFTTGHEGRSSDDDRPEATATTGQNRSESAAVPSSITVSRTRKDPSAAEPPPGENDHPKFPRVDGRDLALDALAEVCEIDPANRTRMREAATALKGSKRPAVQGIEELFWIEYRRWTEAHAEELGELTHPSEWDLEALTRALELAVRLKASLYRQVHPDWELTPNALRKYWLDLKPRPGAGVSGEDLRRGRA